MTEPMPFAVLFDGVLSVIGLVRDGKRRRDDSLDSALFALYSALSETKAYNERLAAGKRRDREREFALADLWYRASVPLRHVDRLLADRCFQKGSYWHNPNVWTPRRIEKNGITLNALMKSTRQLLGSR